MSGQPDPDSYPQFRPHAFVESDDKADFCGYRLVEGSSLRCGHSRATHRWPCSPTCIHDDAWTPGHPERVKERSEAFAWEALSYRDDPAQPNGAVPFAGDAGMCRHRTDRRDTCGDCEYERGIEVGRTQAREEFTRSVGTYHPGGPAAFDQGAEAMRAACWAAVEKELHRYGMHIAVKDFKAAIKDAKP